MASENPKAFSGTLAGAPVSLAGPYRTQGWYVCNDDANNTFTFTANGQAFKVKAGEKRPFPIAVDDVTIDGTGAYRVEAYEDSRDLPDGVAAIGTGSIPDSAVTSAKVADGTLTADDLAADSVGSSEIATDAVGAAEIAAGAVGTSEVAADSLTADDLAADSVEASEIAAGAVGTSEVADNTLTADDLAPDSVAASEIAAGAVGTSEIADGTVAHGDLDATLRNNWCTAAFGTLTAEAANVRKLDIQLKDLNGDNLTAPTKVRVSVGATSHSDSPDTDTGISDGGAGSVDVGGGTADAECTSDATGLLQVDLTNTQVETVYVAVRQAYGGPMVDSPAKQAVEFA